MQIRILKKLDLGFDGNLEIWFNFRYYSNKTIYWNKKIVICVIGNEISFQIFGKILFYGYAQLFFYECD
jgi:hypothetical protein